MVSNKNCDCFAYDKSFNKCRALTTLCCKNNYCKFYKSKEQHKRENQKWGFINKEGNIIVPCEYDKVESSFKDGEGKLARDGKVFIFDKTGKLLDTYEQEIWRLEDNTPKIYDNPF